MKAAYLLTDMSDIKLFIAMITVFTVLVFTVLVIGAFIPRGYPQTSGIFPQVVSCVNQNPDHSTSDPHWQPTLRVKVEPVSGPWTSQGVSGSWVPPLLLSPSLPMIPGGVYSTECVEGKFSEIY